VSAPPLPEIFGNYALGDFVEVVSPEAVSWWPQTVGWKILGLALCALLLFGAGKCLLHWWHNRYRREALARLRGLANRVALGLTTSDINQLLKLTALVPFPREQVASLSGQEWVEFLNGQCAVAPFSPEQQSLLAVGTYQSAVLDESRGRALLGACATWVSEHRDPRHA